MPLGGGEGDCPLRGAAAGATALIVMTGDGASSELHFEPRPASIFANYLVCSSDFAVLGKKDTSPFSICCWTYFSSPSQSAGDLRLA